MSESNPSDQPAGGVPGGGAASSGEVPTETISQSGVQKPPVYVTDMREADTPDTKQARGR
jgi:hypothetical protein